MRLVIDIPDWYYSELQEFKHPDFVDKVIRDGIKLPKGHGRLIDADAFIATLEDASKRHKYKELLIGELLTVDDVFKAVIESLQNKGMAEGDAPTIVKADEKSAHEEERDIDIWQTDEFKAGWKEGYGMGKQDLSKAIMKTLEVNSKKGDTT